MSSQEEACYKAMVEMFAQIDSRPKNILIQIPKGEEYKHMCFQLAQGYEMDWVTYPFIIVNEFGEGEHIDAFNRRHPNFAQDVEEYRKNMNNKQNC